MDVNHDADVTDGVNEDCIGGNYDDGNHDDPGKGCKNRLMMFQRCVGFLFSCSLEDGEDDDVSEMCGILALFGADPQANSELRAELLR